MQGFIAMSKYAGMREDLVQAGGGNSSFKRAADKMLIKASGYQLADITQQDGYAVVNPQKIRQAFLECKNLEKLTDEACKEILQSAFIEGKRPSIETFLHAVSGTYTLHTHPIVVNALTCRQNGMRILAGMFPKALLVPYATPGVELAKAYFTAYCNNGGGKGREFDLVFLQNHGMVVSGNTAEEVIEKTETVTRAIEQYLSCDLEAYHKVTQLWKYFPNRIVWKVTDRNVLTAYEKLGGMWQYTFCPDCVVFLGKQMLRLSGKNLPEEIETFYADFGQPVIVEFCGQLYLLADSVKKALEIQSVLSFSAQVMLLNREEKCAFLSDQEQNFLLNWDAEKYRRNMK